MIFKQIKFKNSLKNIVTKQMRKRLNKEVKDENRNKKKQKLTRNDQRTPSLKSNNWTL